MLNGLLVCLYVVTALPEMQESMQVESYDAVRLADNCVFPINLLLIQDVTGSMETTFPGTVNVTLPALADEMPSQHPSSTFSLAWVKDKPVNTLGELGDRCYEKLVLRAETPESFAVHYASYVPNGGWDWPENQYGAILALTHSPRTFGWMDEEAANLIVLVTDSGPHTEGDGAQAQYPDLQPWGDDVFFDEDLEQEYCEARYYPSASLVQRAILDKNVYLGQIIVTPEDLSGTALRAAQWFNELLSQPPEFVQAHRSDPTHWLAELKQIIRALEAQLCTSDSTAAPETSLTSPQLIEISPTLDEELGTSISETPTPPPFRPPANETIWVITPRPKSSTAP